MFVFTRVQSRFDVDTVLKSLCGMPSLRDICSRHTTKELGSHVTFVRGSSAANFTLSNTCSDMKPYVCDECPKRFYTAHELKRQQLVHSDYRQFCCFFCDAQFKRKFDVKKHFKNTSALFCCDYEQCVFLTLADILAV